MGMAIQSIRHGYGTDVNGEKQSVERPTSRTIKKIKDHIENEPSIVPVVLGVSSIFGAFLGCLWQTTRFASPLLGTFGTILLLGGAHFSD